MHSSNGRRINVPANVKLRECSVVVIGSTCRICGRDFKSITDVALHARWRHNQIVGIVNDSLDRENYFESIGQKCDICDEHLETISDLKAHKRKIHKKQTQDRRNNRKLRLIFKIAGVTMTEITLNRKYLKVHSDNCLIDTGTQTDSFENEKRQNDCFASIDLSLADRVVGNSRVQYIRPYKAANRYIVGKFASTQCDAVVYSTGAPARNLVEISNTPNRDAIFVSNSGSCEEYGNRRDIASPFVASLIDNVDIHNKENSRAMNEQEKRNSNPASEGTSVAKNKNLCCLDEISFNDPRGSLVCQQNKFSRATLTSKQSLSSSENRRDPIGRSNEIAENRIINGPTGSLAEPIEIIIDNENYYDNSDVSTKFSSASLARLNGGYESLRVGSSVDDDVQEVLRITRGKAQCDINHESPNRTEREILVRKAVSEMKIPPTLGSIYSEENGCGLTTNHNNNDTSSTAAIVDACQSSMNVAMLLHTKLDEKLSICLNNLHHYGIRYYNDIPEINNNTLEEYELRAQEDFFEPWRLLGPQYISGLKTIDNEATVVID